MFELDPLQQFDDELAATRRLLRRLEKLAVTLKRLQRKHPRRLAPLFRLRKVRNRLLECERLLLATRPDASVPPRSTVSQGLSTAIGQPDASDSRGISRLQKKTARPAQKALAVRDAAIKRVERQ